MMIRIVVSIDIAIIVNVSTTSDQSILILRSRSRYLRISHIIPARYTAITGIMIDLNFIPFAFVT
jgi:hypothetical protein